MPNCDFFAVGNDHRLILEFLFTSGDCDVHEHSSRFDQRVRVFQSLAEIEEHFAVTDWRRGAGESILLQLYPHGAGGRVEHERVALDPAQCDGAKFREITRGWGLFQLYLEPIRESNGLRRLPHSHTNHNSESRARGWADVIRDMVKPDKWDWARITEFSNRLNRFIRGLGVAKLGSRTILPQAAEMRESGVELR